MNVGDRFVLAAVLVVTVIGALGTASVDNRIEVLQRAPCVQIHDIQPVPLQKGDVLIVTVVKVDGPVGGCKQVDWLRIDQVTRIAP